jgi:hypothetical protein
MAINSLYKDLFKLILSEMKKNLCLVYFISCISILHVSGCASKTEYLSYEDKKGKGAEEFIKDMKICKSYSSENEKQIEGSKAAGERFNYKNSIFMLCMKNKDWILRN